MSRKHFATVASFLCLALVPLACVPAQPGNATQLPANDVKVTIVTNDTKAEWLEIVTKAFNAANKQTASGRRIVVEIKQEGSPGPTVEKIVKGELQPVLWSPGDISWIEQANQMLRDRGQGPIVKETCPRIVYAATGFAMWRPMAEALGWPDKPIGWKQIVNLAADPRGWATYGHPEWGQFTFGHSHPEYSTTGFNMLATLAYAALGKTDGLTPEQVKSKPVRDAFRTVELHTYHYGTSTRGLMTLMAQRGPSYLHAVTASETATLKNNEVQKEILRFPFVFIFPAEGTFWMDNPACIVEGVWVDAEQREAAKIYRDYLLAPEQQDMAVKIGLRPAVPGVPLHAPISLDFGTDPRVSPQTVPPLQNVSGQTAAAIIEVFKETKKNVTVILVLDTSGSMSGDKIKNAVTATGNFISRLADEDKVQLFTFQSQVYKQSGASLASQARAPLSQVLDRLLASGGTAMNDAICTATKSAEALRAEDRRAGEQRLYGIVLLSDGQENSSVIKQDAMFGCMPSGEDVEGVKIFTIAYGKDADAKLLKQIAERTNGKAFAGDPATIDQIYLSISAEQ